MSQQHNQRKHYHIHAPYPHHPPPPPPPTHLQPHHSSSHHQQQQQQWYNAHANVPQQQYHGLHIRDSSRHMQHPHSQSQQQQHLHQQQPPPPQPSHSHTMPPHMFTSGYAGMSGGGGPIVGSTTHNTSAHSMPASGSSSSAQHYSTLAGSSGGVIVGSNSSGNSVVGGGGGSVIVGRSRVYDLEMINTQHSGGGGGARGGGGGFDAFSHSSLYSTQPPANQRLHHHHHQQQQQQQQQQHHHQQQQQQQHYYHHHRIPQQQQQHHHQHPQHMTPMITNIKSEPVEQITITPSIQMEEIIIKPEPMDEMPFHKNAPQMENNTFTMNEERKHQQHQQQTRLQQASTVQEQKQYHQHSAHHQHHHQQQQQHIQHHQQHQHHNHHYQHQHQQQSQPQSLSQSQHHHPHPHQHHSNENISQQQQQLRQHHQPPPPTQRQQQQQQPAAAVSTENSNIPSTAEEKQQQTSLANIKTEPKPLNFPRRKLQTERSSTLPICQRCKQVFLKRQNYTQHVALSCCNIVEYDFKCSICPMSFMSNEELQAHEQLHRSNRYFCQKYCGKYYETIEECEQHEFGQHEYEMFKCNICCVAFPKREQLFSHLMDHRQQPRYDCCICRLCFQTLLDLEDHYVGNPDFCGKFYDKEGFKNLKIFSKPNKTSTQQTINRSENLTSFMIKDITSIKMPETGPSPAKQQKTNHNSPSRNLDDIPDFAAPHVEVKTEIKVEPDFYPPMDQSDFPSFDNDYSNSQDFSSQNSNHNLSFLQDFHDNASNSTNSSYSFNTSGSNSKSSETIQDEDAICCVPKCGVRKFTSPTLQFFPFPRDEKYLSQWLHNLKMTYDPNVNYSIYRVCSLHFPKRCIARYSLSYWAVPTFNLGHDDVGNLYQNRESSGGFPSGEMARCYMPGCLSQRGETNVKFHSFPRDLKTLIKWCQNSRLPVHSKGNRFFCSRHFEEKCFGKFRLKPWAIPTLRLGTVYGKIHDNPNIYQEEKKCFLPFCRRSRSYDCNLSLYRFPRDETLLRRWCYNLRLDPEMYRGKNHKICSSHFVKEALGLRKLNPGAVPTMNLGHNDRFNIYENELYTPPPPPPPPQPSTSSASAKAQKFAELFKQEMGSTSAIYDEVFMNSMIQKFSGTASANTTNLDLGDVCLVPSCKRTRHTDDITLHTIPKRAEQLKKWCHNLKMDLEKMHKSVRICSAHFESYCIGGCMRPFAVPTLELGHDDTDIYRNPDVIKKLNIRETCCVPSCKRNRDRDHANLHRFPTHPELLQKWCENLQKPVPDGTKLFNDAVCEVHFEDRCLRNKRLEKWAIPTINLGYDDVTHHLPSEEEISELWTKPFAPNNGEEQGECCVSSCRRNPQIDDVKLYRPPEDAEQLLKWAHNLQLDAADLPNLRICSLHFESHCIGKRLLNWAMPTLNLASKVEHLFENPPPTQVVYKKKEKLSRLSSSHEVVKWSPRCCLPHCRKTRTHDNVQLFRFPYANRQTLAKWCHNIQLPLVGSSHRRICSVHFESTVLTKRCPMNLAVPTLHLNTPPGYKIYQNPARLKQVKVGVQRQCVIESCHKTRADGVVLFRFPNNRTIFQKWRHNIKNWPKGKMSSQLRICSDHFESHSVGGRRLSPGAIPTLKLGHESDDLYPNETRSFFDLEKCAVNGCDSRKDMEDVRLFRFPRDDEELLQKWCNNLKMNIADCVDIRICGKHFEAECMGPKLLYKWAIPTLHLGHKEDDNVDIIQNPPPEQRPGEYIFKCCVPSCGKTRKYDDAQMNSFPKHLKLFRKWKHNLKLEFLNFKEREKYKICNDHFEPICVGKTRLNFGALPTLNLGHNDNEDLYKINPDRIRPNLFIKQKDIERMERKQIRLEEMKINMDLDEQQEIDQEHDDDALDPLSTPAECCVDDCKAPKSIMREPYDLPETLELRKLWSREIKKDVAELSAESKVCGLHYQQIFGDLKEEMEALKETSPEVKLDYGKLFFAYQKSEISLVINGFQCRVESCGTNVLNSSHRLYYFPYGKDIISKWTYNTGIVPDENRRYMNKVCALHFEPYCITETQRLRSWAIPTLNLNHSDPESIYKNPDLTRIDRRLLGPQILKCAVKNCASAKSAEAESTKLFNFPTDDVLLRKWCVNLKMSRHLTPLLKICSLHFEKLCFGSARIRSWAIPTKNLGHDGEPEYFNKTTIRQEVYEEPSNKTEELQLKQVKIKKSLDSLKCYVASCRRSRLQHGVRFYGLPVNSKMKRKWLHNLQIPSNKAGKVSNLRICNLHFHKRCLEGRQLKAWAVPTMHLGHSDPIFDNPRRLQNPLTVQRCILTHCRNHSIGNENLRTFVFPKSTEFLEKWSKNLKLDVSKCKGRLCHEHFETDVKGGKKLKNGAVPTINLGHDNELPYDNTELIRKLQLKNSQKETELKGEETRGDETINDDDDDDEEEEEEDFDDDEYEDYGIEENEYDEVDEDGEDNDHEEEDQDGENYNEDEEEEEEEEVDMDKVRIRGTMQHWSSIKMKELRVTLVPIRQEDIMEMSSMSSFERDRRSITPANSVRDLRSETPASVGGGHTSSEYNDENSSNTPLRTDKPLNSIAPICCLKHCGKEKTPEQHLTTYGFPKDPQLLQKWCDNLGLQPEECIGRVCIDHFELRVIGTRRLKLGAVPTLNLGNSRVPKHTNDEPKKIIGTESEQKLTESEQILTPPPPYCNPKSGKQSVFRLCCLKHCRRKKQLESEKREDQSHESTEPLLFKFPNDYESLKKWSANLRLPEKTCGRKELRICSKHFEPFVIEGDSLKPNALPTLDLSYSQRPPVFKNNRKDFENTHVHVAPDTNKCFLPHCSKQEGPNTFLIRFPQHDVSTQRKWCRNLKLDSKVRKYEGLKICNHHFETYAFFKQRNLKSGALPTLNLGHADRIFKNLPKIRRKVRTQPKETCCIKTCDNLDPNKLYPFPKNSELRRIWCSNLQIELREALSCHYKLCGKHFTEESFEAAGSDVLKINAVPSLNLGFEVDKLKVLCKIETEDDKFKCVVESCQKSASVDKVKLFEFPKTKELLKKWLFNLNLSPDVDIEKQRICNRHFEKLCIKHGILHDKAVPTMFLKAKSWIYQNDDDVYEENYQCCVAKCNYQTNEEEYRPMYRFPKQKEDIDKWIHNLRLKLEDELQMEVKNLRICSQHFEDACKTKEHLQPGSVPTLQLGHEQTEDIYRNNIRKCCIDNCCWTSFICHKLPEDEVLRNRWLNAYEHESVINNSEYICSIHFVSCYERTEVALDTQVDETLHKLYAQLQNLPELSTFKCSVSSCETGFKLTTKLFKFPKDVTLLQKWLHNSSLTFNYNDRPRHRICARHFEERCLSEKKLHRWSLPTLALPYNLSLYVNPPEALPSNHENLKHCCVSSCNTVKGPFFKFPTKLLEVKKWIHNLDLGAQQCTLNLRVCHKHFESYCVSTDELGNIKKLKCWSVPTLNLTRTIDLYPNPPDKVDYFACCVCGELQNKEEGLYLFRFPSRLSSFLKWLHNLRLQRQEYRDSMRICLKHFESDCFDKTLKLLRKHSVPTIGVACPINDMFQNPTRRTISKCCVPSCEGPWLHLNVFPKDKILLKKWCFNLNIKETNLESLKNWKICQKHFENECLNAFGLIRPTAVPTLNLGHNHKIFNNSILARKVKQFTIEGSKSIKPQKFQIKKRIKLEKQEPMSVENAATSVRAKGAKRNYLINKKIKIEVQESDETPKISKKTNTEPTTEVSAETAAKSETTKTKQSKKIKHITKIDQLSTAAEACIEDPDKTLSMHVKNEQEKCAKTKVLKKTKITTPMEVNDTPNSETSTANMDKTKKEQNIKTKVIKKTKTPKVNEIATIKSSAKLLSNCKPKKINIKREKGVKMSNKINSANEIVEKTKSIDKSSIEADGEAYAEDLDKYKTLGDYINERKKIKALRAKNTVAITKKTIANRKINKRWMPFKPEPVDRPLLDFIIEKVDVTSNTAVSPIEETHSNTRPTFCVKEELLTKTENIFDVQEISPGLVVKLEPIEETAQKILDENNERPASVQRLGSLQKCSISTCANVTNSPGILFFKYPPIQRLRAIWIRHCQETCKFVLTLNKKRKICAEHFEDQCFIQNRLLLGSIPTLCLGPEQLNLDDCAELLKAYRNMRCRVDECQRSVELDQIHKISFPQGELKKKWCFNLNINEAEVTSDDWICHRHFERRVLIKNKRIKEEAVPTLLLGSHAKPPDKLYQNPEYINQQQYFIQLRQVCCVESCPNTRKMLGVRLASFPKRKDIYDKWLHNLDLEDSQVVRNGYHICWEHFEEICYTKYNYLKIGSIPTLKLDKQSDLIPLDKTQLIEVDSFGKRIKSYLFQRKYKCYHPQCTEWKLQVYTAPKIPQLRTLWLNSVGLQLTSNADDDVSFCDEHFYCLYKEFETTTTEIDRELYGKELDSLRKTYEENSVRTKFFSKKCLVPQCPTDHYFTPYKDIKLYGLPHNPQMAKKWCFNCSIDYDKLEKHKFNYYKICDRHFESYCFTKRSIYSWALPTLNLPDSRPLEILENDPDDKNAFTGECCIQSCINANGYKPESKTRLYTFPKNPETLAKWIDITNCETFREDITKICGRHFRLSYIKKRKLTDDAIPTLRLGHNEEQSNLIADSEITIKEEEVDDYDLLENEDDNKIAMLEERGKDMLVEQKVNNAVDEWNDHDYCHEIITDTFSNTTKFEVIAIKQEIIEDQYGFEEEQQQTYETPIIKQEIIEIDETHNYDQQEDCVYYDESVGENVTLPLIEPVTSSNNFHSLVISEVKCRIFICCVQKCTSTSESRNIKLYTEFPNDSEIFIKWCFNIKIDPRNYKENQYAICSQHFDSICFANSDMTLHPWAVPTLNLNLPENSFIHYNDPPSEQCIVYGCIQPMQPLYKFPLRLDLCQKWFANLKLDLTDYRVHSYRICRKHFAPECFDSNHILRTESIPTLYLGHADSIAHLNTFEVRMQQEYEGAVAAFGPGDVMAGVVGGGGLDNSRGSSQGSIARQLISPNDLEDHDSSYYEDFEECYGVDE